MQKLCLILFVDLCDDDPGSLTDNDAYAVTAYLLYLNNLIDVNAVIDKLSLPKVKMPNEDGFVKVYEVEETNK